MTMDDVFRMARGLASMGMPAEDVSKATGMAPDEVRRFMESDARGGY